MELWKKILVGVFFLNTVYNTTPHNVVFVVDDCAQVDATDVRVSDNGPATLVRHKMSFISSCPSLCTSQFLMISYDFPTTKNCDF